MSEQDLNNVIDILLVIVAIIATIIILIISFAIYFLPSIIAKARKHSHKLAIFFLNLFAGATGVGWVVAFVWAFIDKPLVQVEGKPTVAQELKELAQLKEQGIITEEEFETKKNKLLNY